MNINNQKSLALVCKILIPVNVALFCLHYFYIYIQFGELARTVGMVVNAVDFVAALICFLLRYFNEDQYNRIATPSTMFISSVIAINSSIFVAVAGGIDNLIVLFVEFIGISILLHGNKIRVPVFLSILMAFCTSIVLTGPFDVNYVLQPAIILCALIVIISNFRHKMDLQLFSIVQKKSELESAYQDLARAKKYIEDNQFDIIQKARTQSLMEMAGGVAHEINNPLAIIKGMTEGLLKKSSKSTVTHKNIEETRDKVSVAVGRISEIVTSLRAFAAISGDKVQPTITLAESLRTLNNLIGYTEGKSQYKFSVSIDGSIQGEFDIPIEVLQILVTLIKNSVDAVSENSNSWIKLNIGMTGKIFSFQVIDSGDGVSPFARDNIFDPFFTTKEVGAGKGLGLSEARGLAHQINGSLECDFRAKDTTFELRFEYSSELAA
jgi:signal transduction histidine kinase